MKAVAASFGELNGVSEAISVANRIEDTAIKISVFLDLANLVKERGILAVSKWILLNRCLPVARSHPTRKIEHLLDVAEKLIVIGANQEASEILAELIDILPKHGQSMSLFKLEIMEAVAVLLIRSGLRSKAIDLMTTEWLPEEYLATLSPEKAESGIKS